MKIHYIQNDPLATLGFIEKWVSEKNFTVTRTQMFENEPLPSVDDFDLLIILGGRMGAYEVKEFPWLETEKEFIKEAIDKKKLVLGICLGAQMIAKALGGNVYPHRHQEIGWWPIELTAEAEEVSLFNGIPKTFTVFEFHGDTFDLPEGATHLATSEACRNQAFSYGDKVVGLQFHPEFTGGMVSTFAEKFGPKLRPETFIQDPLEWTERQHLAGAESIIRTILENMAGSVEV